MRTEVILSLVLASVLLIVLASSAVEAGPAVVKTVVTNPGYEGCPLIADNETEYKVDVYLDNTPLNGEPTQGIEWKIIAPQGAEMTITRVAGNSGNPPENDFFAGRSMAFEIVRPLFGELHGRLTWNGQGVSNGRGNVATYWIKVNSVTRPMRTSFDLRSIGVYKDDGQATLQDFVEENQQFVILPDNFPALTAKCAR